jgi:hypothetical protein
MPSVGKFVSVLGSLLSDLSYSRSEDDLDSTLTRSGKIWKRHRPSLTAVDEAASPKKRRSAVEKTVEVIYPFRAECKKKCKIHNYKSCTLVCAVFRMAVSHDSNSTADGTGCDVSAMFFSFHRLITVLFCHTVWTVQLIKR